MAPQTAPKVFSAKPGMLDIEFDCSSGFSTPVRSYKEEHNVRPAQMLAIITTLVHLAEISHDAATVQTRPDPSNHVVARLFYPGCPDSPRDARQAYIPHSNYAYGLAKFLTAQLQQWCAFRNPC